VEVGDLDDDEVVLPGFAGFDAIGLPHPSAS